MFNKADILEMLKSGATVEDVAAQLTDVLNAANKEYTALQKEEAKRQAEEEAAKAEDERVYNAKREAVCMMLDGLIDFLIAAGEDELVQEVHNVEIADVVSMVDDSLATVRQLLKLKDLQFDNSDTLFNLLFS